MLKKTLLLIPILSLAVHASDDEMKTETKIDPSATKTDSSALKPPLTGKSAPSNLDPKLRAKIRAKAPFWIEDSSHGAAVRINKDGTISSETQGGGSIAGSWKALKGGQLEIQWSDGGEKYSYPVGSGKGGLTIKGRSAQKNRFKLN